MTICRYRFNIKDLLPMVNSYATVEKRYKITYCSQLPANNTDNIALLNKKKLRHARASLSFI